MLPPCVTVNIIGHVAIIIIIIVTVIIVITIVIIIFIILIIVIVVIIIVVVTIIGTIDHLPPTNTEHSHQSRKRTRS